MTTVNSADKMQGCLKFGVYYFKFYCKGVLISGGVFSFPGVIGGILWVCNKTQL